MSIINDDEDGLKPRPTDITGNAATATKLRTARLINNLPFDGSTDVRITDLSGATGSDGKPLTTHTDFTAGINGVTQSINNTNKNLSQLQDNLKLLSDSVNESLAKQDGRIKNNETAIGKIKPSIGDGQRRTELLTFSGQFRVNSTGRTIEVTLLCENNKSENTTFQITRPEGTLASLALASGTTGTISCIIPPDTWWAPVYANYEHTAVKVTSLQDRDDFEMTRICTAPNGNRYRVDVDGSEDRYIQSDWVQQ